MAATADSNNPQTIPTASWTVAPATVDDMEALVDVHTAAFRSDLFSHLMLLGRPDGAHQDLIRKSLDYWFSNPRISVTKAVDADGSILAWACWALRDDDPAPVQPSSSSKVEADKQKGEKDTEASPSETAAAAKEPSAMPAPVAANTASPNDDPARALAGHMRADVLRREAAHMPRGAPGAGCLVLQALATEPHLQGRGIATQLVRAGMLCTPGMVSVRSRATTITLLLGRLVARGRAVDGARTRFGTWCGRLEGIECRGSSRGGGDEVKTADFRIGITYERRKVIKDCYDQ